LAADRYKAQNSYRNLFSDIGEIQALAPTYQRWNDRRQALC